MIKCVIFDADGMLNLSERFSIQHSRDVGIPRDKFNPFFSGVFQQCLIGKADLKNEIKKHLVEWGWDGNVDTFLQHWFKLENKIDARFPPLIVELRKNGMKCVLATNQEKYRTEYLRDEMGFGTLFDAIFSSAYMGCKKPESAFFEKIFQEIGKEISKNEVMFWDDDQKNVAGAAHYGFNAFLFTNFNNFEKEVNMILKSGPAGNRTQVYGSASRHS